MITLRANLDKFNRAMRDLSKQVNVNTATFVKNEARLLAEELAKKFQPKMPKSKEGIKIDRRIAMKVAKTGTRTIPWDRIQRAMWMRRTIGGKKPIVQAAVAYPSQRKAIQRLGTLAAGFLGKGNKLGAKARAFVTAHIGESYGTVEIFNNPFRKMVRLKNFTPWLAGIRGRKTLVIMAIGRRASAMRSNAKRLAQGVGEYWRRSK